MLAEDQGVGRFFYKVIGLEPFQPGEADLLIRDKLGLVLDDAMKKGISFNDSPCRH